MQNPFRYGTKVTGHEFYDRDEIKKSLENVINGANNAVICGPRRYGKSSLVMDIIRERRKSGTICIYLNMMNMASLEDFIRFYAKSIYEQVSPAIGKLKSIAEVFKHLRPVISIDDNGRPNLSVAIAENKASVADLREVLNMPEQVKPKNKDMLIVLDEFQEIAAFGIGAQFERTMRSVIEEHSDISYIFLGSKSHMMKRMFAAPSRPFYRSAQIFLLSRPPQAQSIAFLISRFKSAGITLPEKLSGRIVALSENVPYYIQALGSWVFRFVSERSSKLVSQHDVDSAFSALYESERELFENIFQSLPSSQRITARAIAKEPVECFTEEYRHRHLLPGLSTVNTAVRRLIADARIDIIDGKYTHLDPLLAHHLRATAN